MLVFIKVTVAIGVAWTIYKGVKLFKVYCNANTRLAPVPAGFNEKYADLLCKKE